MADLQAGVRAAARRLRGQGRGANGSAAYADIDSGLAVAVMRNGPPAGGLAAVTRIDRLAGTEESQ
jgi:hypothetical protein